MNVSGEYILIIELIQVEFSHFLHHTLSNSAVCVKRNPI